MAQRNPPDVDAAYAADLKTFRSKVKALLRASAEQEDPADFAALYAKHDRLFAWALNHGLITEVADEIDAVLRQLRADRDAAKVARAAQRAVELRQATRDARDAWESVEFHRKLRMNPASAEAVAQTILDQIGRRTRMELGVRELAYGNFDDEGVSRPGLMGRASGSKIQRGGKFIVMLDEGRDTYVVRVMTVMNHGLKVTEKAYLTDVYAESLPRVLTSVFG